MFNAKRQICTSLAAGLLYFSVGNALAQDIPSFIRSQHRASLQAYLAQHPHLSFASDSLCKCEDLLADLRTSEQNFQPYYAVGDINDDGIEDFAVGLINNTRAPDAAPLLTIVIFHGPFSLKRQAKGVAVLTDYAMQRSEEALSVLPPKTERGYRYPARLALGSPAGTDDFVQMFFDWKKRKYYVGPG